MRLASYLYQSADTMRLGWIAVAVGALILAVGAIFLVHALLERPLARFRKIRSARVEIISVTTAFSYSNTDKGMINIRPNTSQIKKRETVGVRFLDRKWLKRKEFYMSPEGMDIGDQGVLTYRGKYGIEFQKTASVKDEKDDRYYHFAKRPPAETKQRR